MLDWVIMLPLLRPRDCLVFLLIRPILNVDADGHALGPVDVALEEVEALLELALVDEGSEVGEEDDVT